MGTWHAFCCRPIGTALHMIHYTITVCIHTVLIAGDLILTLHITAYLIMHMGTGCVFRCLYISAAVIMGVGAVCSRLPLRIAAFLVMLHMVDTKPCGRLFCAHHKIRHA